MTPQKPANGDEFGHITWGTVGKAVISLLVAWAAWEFRQMREAVYTTSTRIAVVESRVHTLEKDADRTDKRVSTLEAKILGERK